MKALKLAALAVLLMGTAGMVSAQTAPELAISVAAPASVNTGADRTIATIGLHAGDSDVRLESLPISLGFSNPAIQPFTNCALRNTATGAALNTGSNALGPQGSADFEVVFDTAAIVPADTTAVLYLTCTIPATVPNGSAVATSIFISQVEATSGGDSVTVEGRDPQAGTTNKPLGVAIISSATPGIPGTGDTPGTDVPGIPNTGFGDGIALWALFGLMALVALAAGAYAMRRA